MTFSGWWFQIFFIFTPTWGNDPIWLIILKWLETTNQMTFFLNQASNSQHLSCRWNLILKNGQVTDRQEIRKSRSLSGPHFGTEKETLGIGTKCRWNFWVEILLFCSCKRKNGKVTRTEMQPQKTSWRSFFNLFSVWWCSESWWMMSWFVYIKKHLFGGSWRLKGETSRMHMSVDLLAGQPTPWPLVSLSKALLNLCFWGGVR